MNFFIVMIVILMWIEIESGFNRINCKLDRMNSVRKGEKDMSKICNELVGKKCSFVQYGEVIIGSMPVYTILDIDEEYIKVSRKYKKNKEKVSIIRIDNINSIELVEE